ncbi:MAG: MFS transporter [Alicyclobacillus sp.]|nr:MFS transporter [Alicyclobacillus sp.]
MRYASQTSTSSGWKLTLALFFVTSIVESMGMSHVFSFLPVYLQQMNISHVETWVGILNSLTFVLGLPLVPLWGVWADRFGGKAVIIRSAYVEMIVFLALGLSTSLAGVFISMLLIGFQLGNTGIMLAVIRRLVPHNRVGFAVSLFSVSSPVGMAFGPLLGGLVTASHLVSLHGLFESDGVLSFLTGTMLLLFYRETRVTPDALGGTESAWATAWKSVQSIFTLRITWILFGAYTVVLMGRQMVSPYLPMVIEQLDVHMADTTVLIGSLMGLTALVGAIITVFAGKLGDKVGFTRILSLAFAIGVPVTLLLGMSQQPWPFTLYLTLFSAMTSIGGAMVFALFSTRIPETHRSTALNLVYLPLYVGGIVGPAIASWLASLAQIGPFIGASALFCAGFLLVRLTLARSTPVVLNTSRSAKNERQG